MCPEVVARAASLFPRVNKPAMTVCIHMDDQGVVMREGSGYSVSVEETFIRSCC